MKSLVFVGSIGFAVNLLLNLFTLLALHRSAAVFFSGQWYGDWFPLYVVWFTFIVVGSARRGSTRSAR